MKAPFKVLFSNDTTNIQTCVSPYHKKGESWRPEMLEATVDEVAGTGVEVHMIQLAHGQVPWYQSKVYPMAEHHKWWQEHFGVAPEHDVYNGGGIHRYILDGGDLLQVFIDRCRKTGQVPFVSLRLNDVHFADKVNIPGNTEGIHAIGRFYAKHLNCRIGENTSDWLQRTLNWANPDIPEHMFSLIEEQCENYDIDGFELDFMRFPSFFRVEETTSGERADIMANFIKRVRAVLDRTAKQDRHRWLCVRIPAFQSAHDQLGIDLPRWVKAGVEMVNLSYFYFTAQDGDVAAIRERVPDASVYVEMCHTTRVGPIVAKGSGDTFSFRRTTPTQYYTTAHLAYARGLDGVSAFNFVYYREHGAGPRGPFNEPPFVVFKHLGDAHWLGQQPQHYFLAEVWNTPRLTKRLLPKTMEAGQAATFHIDMAPPTGVHSTGSGQGWKKGGRLRIQSPEPLGDSRWKAVFNGIELQETLERSEPYNNPYPPLLGTPDQHRAWIVPPQILKDGMNTIEVALVAGLDQATIVFLDAAVE